MLTINSKSSAQLESFAPLRQRLLCFPFGPLAFRQSFYNFLLLQFTGVCRASIRQLDERRGMSKNVFKPKRARDTTTTTVPADSRFKITFPSFNCSVCFPPVLNLLSHSRSTRQLCTVVRVTSWRGTDMSFSRNSLKRRRLTNGMNEKLKHSIAYSMRKTKWKWEGATRRERDQRFGLDFCFSSCVLDESKGK